MNAMSAALSDADIDNLATYLASLQRVLDEEPGAVVPSHGGIAHDGGRLLQGFLRHRAQRESKLLRGLGRERVGETELLEMVYDDAPPQLRRLAARSLAAGLEKLEEEGRIQRHPGGSWSMAGG